MRSLTCEQLCRAPKLGWQGYQDSGNNMEPLRCIGTMNKQQSCVATSCSGRSHALTSWGRATHLLQPSTTLIPRYPNP